MNVFSAPNRPGRCKPVYGIDGGSHTHAISIKPRKVGSFASWYEPCAQLPCWGDRFKGKSPVTRQTSMAPRTVHERPERFGLPHKQLCAAAAIARSPFFNPAPHSGGAGQSVRWPPIQAVPSRGPPGPRPKARRRCLHATRAALSARNPYPARRMPFYEER